MKAHPPRGAHGVEAEDLARLLSTPPVPDLSDDRLHDLREGIMNEIRIRPPRESRRAVVIAVAAAVAVLVALGGVALAGRSGSHRPSPKILFPTPLTGSPTSPTPYPTNAAGQTYGGDQEGAMADLQSVVAKRGENGYCWATDLDGPMPMGLEEAAWIDAATDKRREIAVYESDGVTQVGVFISGGGAVRGVLADGTVVTKELSNEVAKQPPVWLFDQMKNLASNAGDANAWAWWTLTTAEKAAAATGNSAAGMTDPDRPVYVAFILGDFTKWLWSLPEGASAPEYSWIYELIDGGAHEVDGSGASAKPFESAKNLDLNIVGLRDRIKI